MSSSSPSGNCSEVRAQINEILQGQGTPNELAMNLGSQPEWTRVITQKCSISPQVHLSIAINWPVFESKMLRFYCEVIDVFFLLSQETCESGCVLPNSLLIQVLWARQGLLDLPQNYILGAKYVFQCQKHKVGKDAHSV